MPFTVKNKASESPNYEISAIKIQTMHCRPVYNSAGGTVFSVIQTDKTKTVIIKHQCSLYSRYDNLVDCNLKTGAAIPQGQQIAQTGKDGTGFSINFSLLIDINEILFNQKEETEV
ncbi:MAG: peptidoglycan DD-metalloendopeptidase family protein [Spirochaetaceae bacterium]|nr:peptidoglycan DD-metalloendopeptidase family protein [Spirochaetaceae bacterium]